MIRSVGLAMVGLFLSVATAAAAPNPSERNAMRKVIVEEALNSPLPPSLALALAKVESDFDPRAVSGAGARGLMQIMPRTAEALFGVGADELWNARLNAQLGIDYLARLVRTYGGRWDLALSHYNGGSLTGSGQSAVAHSFTRDYVGAVLRWERVFAGELAAERRAGGWVPARTQVPQPKPVTPIPPPSKSATAIPPPQKSIAPLRPSMSDYGEAGRWTQIGASSWDRVIADQARAIDRLTALLAERRQSLPTNP